MENLFFQKVTNTKLTFLNLRKKNKARFTSLIKYEFVGLTRECQKTIWATLRFQWSETNGPSLTVTNKAMINNAFNSFIDQVKDETETRSQRGLGWVFEQILDAFIDVARFEPFRGGTYFPLPERLKNKKALRNIQNKDNPQRPSSYPTNRWS